MATLDITGLTSPRTIVIMRKCLGHLISGDVLTVHADDAFAVQDVPSFCKNTGHHLLMAHEKKGVYIFEIKKG
jgi:tRNA 2-thiouridine synthesizing protein A